MKVMVELPIRLDVTDYHEFNDLRDHFRKLNPIIKVKEIGGHYSGIAYIRELTDPANAKIVNEIVAEDKADE